MHLKRSLSGTITIALLLQSGAVMAAFSDVPPNQPNADAIAYLEENGIVQGYPDGTYRPQTSINRVEFTKIIVGSRFSETQEWCLVLFPDVPEGAWFTPYVCTAKKHGIIGGYPDGTFQPARNINVAEAAKIIVRSFGIETRQDVAVWYKPYIDSLAERNALPTSIRSFDMPLTRGDMAEIVYRLSANITTKPSLTYDDLTQQSSSSSASVPTGPFIVSTTGNIRGIESSNGLLEGFLGIPYAETPVGALRFKPTQPVRPWNGTLIADTLGDACVQFLKGMNSTPGFNPLPPQSEDCLNLNIWRPKNAKNLPILFWIHGGSFISDAGSLPVYNDEPALAQDAIVVTINYRLGTLGLLAHSALSDESSQNISGNWNLWDILTALKWTHDNAEALGGDPDRIMIFGQSSGAANVLSLLVSPKASGLFSSAIVHSGPFWHYPLPPLRASSGNNGEKLGEAFAAELGCDTSPPSKKSTDVAQCLRSKSTADFQNAWWALIVDGSTADGLSASPYVDGVLIPDTFQSLYKKGAFNRVPVVMGTVRDEMFGYFGASSWTDLANKLNTEGAILGVQNLEGLRALYNKSTYADPSKAYQAFRTDAEFLCATHAALRTIANFVPARGFYYTHTPSYYKILGAGHALELPFIFGATSMQAKFTSDELSFSDVLRRAWTSVATGNPSVQGIGPWPLFKQDTVVQLNEDVAVVNNVQKSACDFFDSENIYDLE